VKAREWSAGDLAMAPVPAYRGMEAAQIELVFIRAVRRRNGAAQVEVVATGVSFWCETHKLGRPTLARLRAAARDLTQDRARVTSLLMHVELTINGRVRR